MLDGPADWSPSGSKMAVLQLRTNRQPLHRVELHQIGWVQNLQRVAVMGTNDLH